MSKKHFQIVIVGSGFAGSLMAMIARRLGFATALIERGRHPRFAIGESSTPLANLILEEISDAYDLPFVRPLSKWGTWQKQFPELPVGLKRGFTFYHHEFGRPYASDVEHRRQLLVGASPNDLVADTHWYRPELDHYLVRQAQNLGAAFWDETNLVSAREEAGIMRLAGTRKGDALEVTADFVIDATGPHGFLHRALGLPEKFSEGFQPTQGLFSHFASVGPLPGDFSGGGPMPPYPPEQAAVHHIFPRGWVWVLKFNNGITSAGVAAQDELAEELKFNDGEAAWRRLLERLPSLAEIFATARAVTPFIHLPRLAFQSGVVTGSCWALLPYAAGFVDPLLSTGFPLTLLGITRLARLLKSDWQQASFKSGLTEYAALTTLELEAASRLVRALYATMNRFALFKDLSLLYFAAASYSESVRRLGRPHLDDAFLLSRHPIFAPRFRQLCESATQPLSNDEAERLGQNIRQAIEPFDVAGLADHGAHSWYPARPSDLIRNASKLDASEAEITTMLQKCGLLKTD